MASLFRIPTSKSLFQLRFLSSTNHNKSRELLSLLRTETNPNKILHLIRSTPLSPHHHLHRISLSLAISTLSKNKHFETITQLISETLQNNPTFTITLYGKANMLSHTIQTFNNEFPQTVKSLNALLHACLITKDYEQAKRIYYETNIERDVETYNRMIRVLCECGSSSLTYGVVYDMGRGCVKPSKETFGLMIDGFYREGKYGDVKRVLRMMKEFGVYVGVGTYNVMVKCLCERRRSVEAKGLFSGSRVRPNGETYMCLIRGFCDEGDVDEAMGLFVGMVKSGYKADSECYFALVRGLCRVGDFETALVVCYESMERNWVPSFSVMRWIVEGLVSVSKVDEARKLVAVMKGKFTRNVYLWDEVEAGLPR